MSAGRLVHALVILGAVAVYTFYVGRGLSSTLKEQMWNSFEKEMEKNPVLKQDYMAYKEELRKLQDKQAVKEKFRNRKEELLTETQEIQAKMNKLQDEMKRFENGHEEF